jgi:chitinase
MKKIKKIICLISVFLVVSCIFAVNAETEEKNGSNYKLFGYLDCTGWDNTTWLLSSPYKEHIIQYDFVLIGFAGVAEKKGKITVIPPEYNHPEKGRIAINMENLIKFKEQNPGKKVLISWGGASGPSAKWPYGLDPVQLGEEFAHYLNDSPVVDGIDFDLEGFYPFQEKPGEFTEHEYHICIEKFKTFIDTIRKKTKRNIIITAAPQPYFDGNKSHLVFATAVPYYLEEIVNNFDYILVQFYNVGEADKKFGPIENNPDGIGEFFDALSDIKGLTRDNLVVGKPANPGCANSGYNDPKNISIEKFSKGSCGIMVWDINHEYTVTPEDMKWNFIDTISKKIKDTNTVKANITTNK